MPCSTVLQITASRSCNGCRTMLLGSYSKSLDNPMPCHYSGSCTCCPFSSGSTTKWPCWRSRSTACRRRCTFDTWSRSRSTSTTYDLPPFRCLNQHQGQHLRSELFAAQRPQTATHYRRQWLIATLLPFLNLGKRHSFSHRLTLFPFLTFISTLSGHSASEVTIIRHYTNMCIIIIINNTHSTWAS